MTACPIRRCPGELQCYETLVQDGTGDELYRYECTANFRHRAWLIRSLGVLHKEAAPRWATSKLAARS